LISYMTISFSRRTLLLGVNWMVSCSLTEESLVYSDPLTLS